MDSDVLDYYDGRERSLPYLSLPYGVSRREYPGGMSGGHPGFQFAYNTPILTPPMWDAYSAWARGQGLDPIDGAHDYDMQGAFLREFAMPLDARGGGRRPEGPRFRHVQEAEPFLFFRRVRLRLSAPSRRGVD